MAKRLTEQDYQVVGLSQSIEWIGAELPKNNQTRTRWRCSYNHEWETLYASIQQGHGCPHCAKRALKTPTDYHNIADENGLIWLGPEVPNAKTKTWFKCANGHNWHVAYEHIRAGNNCPHCPRETSKLSDDYHALAAIKSFKWLGPMPQRIRYKSDWQCSLGHIFTASYESIVKIQDCPICTNRAAKSEQDYHKAGAKYGFSWLDTLPENTRIKTRWRCRNGHEFEANYNSVRNGHDCPYCSGAAPRNAGDYATLARERGIFWLGPYPLKTSIKTEWQCEMGHRWMSSFNNMNRHAKKGCPHCWGKFPKAPEEYHMVAAYHNLVWLGPEVPNVSKKTRWQCPKGHVWETTYSAIKLYTCPECRDMVNGRAVSKPQRKLHEMLGGELNYPVHRYRLDVALPDEKICAEYDCWYWHELNSGDDAKRDHNLIRDGWRVLRIKSSVQLPTLSQLNTALALLRSGETYAEIILDDWES